MKIEGGATPNALLGLLSLGPMSGYDIKALIDRSIGYFWSESYGQIYPSLKRLTAAGLVEKKTARQEGRPDKHVYSLTAAGRMQLREWLKVPVTEEVNRNELLLKLFFGERVAPSVSRDHVTACLETHERAVKTYDAIARGLRKDAANDPQLPYWLMTVSFGSIRSAALVKWAKETLKELERIEKTQKK